MSRLLSDLLGAREPAFTQHIRRLEHETGNPGVDLRLSSDIAKKVRLKLRELGLDPSDTNGTELYHALQNLVKKHDEFLTKRLSINSAKSKDVIHGVVTSVKNLPIPQNCWVLKHSTAKKLLKQMPPKHVMKAMHYRSVDSLLKRADIDEVFAAMHFVEAPSWLERFNHAYKKLTPLDFETRKVNVIEMSPQRWSSTSEKYIHANHRNIVRVSEMGVVAVLPMPVSKLEGLTITLLPMIIYHINEIRTISSYLKLNQVKPDFTAQFIKAISGLLDSVATLYGQPVDWQTIHKHFGSSSDSQPEVFLPHIQPEDLSWKQAEDVLYRLEPALKFWEDLDYAAAPFKNRPVPLGLLDNAVSYCNQLDYGEQSLHYFRESLRRELFIRYLRKQVLEEQVTQQFDYAPAEADIFIMMERGWR